MTERPPLHNAMAWAALRSLGHAIVRGTGVESVAQVEAFRAAILRGVEALADGLSAGVTEKYAMAARFYCGMAGAPWSGEFDPRVMVGPLPARPSLMLGLMVGAAHVTWLDAARAPAMGGVQ